MTYIIDETLEKALHNTVDSLTKEIARAQGLTCDFVLSVSQLLDPEYNYAIKAGYPPTLIVNAHFVMSLILSEDEKLRKKSKVILRKALAAALTKIPKMERSLSNEPIAELVAKKEDKVKWIKTAYPDKLFYDAPVQSEQVEFPIRVIETYTITMERADTGLSITVSGDNPGKLKLECRRKLIEAVRAQEKLFPVENITEEIKPSSVKVKYNTITDSEEAIYSFNEAEIEAKIREQEAEIEKEINKIADDEIPENEE